MPKKKRERDYLLLRTLAGTGIRIGELSYITVEALREGRVEIQKKNKVRTIFIPTVIADCLRDYCRRRAIVSGVVFSGADGTRALHPSGVWKKLKKLADLTGVERKKAYPHSCRHLFAKTYMQKVGNIFELADLMGHSSIETTRLYALTSNQEKINAVNSLDL